VIETYLPALAVAVSLALPLAILLGMRSFYRNSRAETHDPFAAGLTDAVVTQSLEKLVTEGRRAGRRVRLTFEGAALIFFEVQVPGYPGSLTLDAQQARAWVAASGSGAHADEARAALGHLLSLGVYGLEVERGWLRVGRTSSNYARRLTAVQAVFGALERLAPLFSRAPLTIRVAQADVSVRAWEIDEKALCPFCRDDLGKDDLVACDACHTAHHRECLDEAGGCTVFGCSGRPPLRERAPA
jgi:hypothetical protein